MRRPPTAARVRRSLFLLLLCCCCLATGGSARTPAVHRRAGAGAAEQDAGALGFCSAYGGGGSCCYAALRKRFDAMNISDAACAGVVKSVLCAECNPFSAELFNSSSNIQMVPLLCNYTSSASSAQSKDSTQDYCKLVLETCKNVTIVNSPFQPPLQGSARLPSSSSKLKDVWQSEDDFCTSFGGSSGDQSLCFNGDAVFFNSTEPSPTPKGICLERIGNGSYLNMAPHPDGSNRVFLGASKRQRFCWLALEFDPMMLIDAMWWTTQMCGEGTLLSVEWLWPASGSFVGSLKKYKSGTPGSSHDQPMKHRAQRAECDIRGRQRQGSSKKSSTATTTASALPEARGQSDRSRSGSSIIHLVCRGLHCLSKLMISMPSFCTKIAVADGTSRSRHDGSMRSTFLRAWHQ